MYLDYIDVFNLSQTSKRFNQLAFSKPDFKKVMTHFGLVLVLTSRHILNVSRDVCEKFRQIFVLVFLACLSLDGI